MPHTASDVMVERLIDLPGDGINGFMEALHKAKDRLRKGTSNRKRIALTIVRDLLDEASFDASPG